LLALHRLGTAEGFGGMYQVQLERHRASRYPFEANVELTDVQSETQIQGEPATLAFLDAM
jgi:hypothetical protein